jgi:Flp pilus assembly protein TadG
MARALRAAAPGPRRGRGRPGIVCVELAVVLGFLTALVVGMLEISRALQVRQVLTDAARKGCRTGILHQYGNSDIISDATNILRDNGFDATKFNPTASPPLGSITIAVTDPSGTTLSDSLDAPQGSTVSVQVAIPASSIRWVPAAWLGDNTLVSDLVVMMKQ